MTRVKVYDLGTGHVETVSEHNYPAAEHADELFAAQMMVTTLINQDHGTDTVYYIEEETPRVFDGTEEELS